MSEDFGYDRGLFACGDEGHSPKDETFIVNTYLVLYYRRKENDVAYYLRITLVLLIWLLLIPALAKADTFTVTNLNNSGDGSLRQAILDANNNAGDDDIVFQSGLSGILPTGGDSGNNTFTTSMQISGNVTITGPGADEIIIDAQNIDRIIIVSTGVVSISGLTFINGFPVSGGGGAIFNGANLSIDSCVFDSNQLDEGGGAIFSDNGSTITEITNTTFNLNTAGFEGGAIALDGATIQTIANSVFSGNFTLATAGAIFLSQGSVIEEITNTTFSGNRVSASADVTSVGQGGAIFNAGTINLISQSTFSANMVSSDTGATEGGAIHGGRIGQIINSTFTGNKVENMSGTTENNGGAIFSRGDITISFSTIANNEADTGGGIFQDAGSVEIRNSIVAFNEAQVAGDNCNTAIATGTDETNNYSDNNDCGFGSTLMSAGDLGPLANNGGTTETLALENGPAIGGASTDCDPLNSDGMATGVALTIDQRGFPRPEPNGGTECDSGAFETQPAGKLTIVKMTDPSGGDDFEFMGTGFPEGCGLMGTFFLDDTQSQSCVLSPGDYTVEEIVPAGFELDISCTKQPSSETDKSVTIELEEGDDVTCTFTNTAEVTLTLTIAGTGSGTVNITPPNEDCEPDCTQGYAFGTDVTLSPEPGSLSKFDGFSGDDGCGEEIEMNEDLNCIATFSPRQVTLKLTISGTGGGTVNLNPPDQDCETNCSQTYNAGTNVVLSPMPNSLSVFDGFSGNPDCAANINITEDLNCTATFSPRQVTLKVTIAGRGTGTVLIDPPGATCEPDCTHSYNAGTEVTMTPTAGPDSIFVGFSGDSACQENFIILQNLNCTANFTEVPEILLFNGQPAQGGVVKKGQINKVKIVGVTPNKRAALIWGFQEGSGTLRTKKCGDIQVKITRPRVLGKFKANANGMINRLFFMPFTFARQAFFQTVDLSTCVSGPVVQASLSLFPENLFFKGLPAQE